MHKSRGESNHAMLLVTIRRLGKYDGMSVEIDVRFLDSESYEEFYLRS